MGLSEATERICRSCLETNLTEEIKVSRCAKCQLLYCIHFASAIDPSNCVECLSNVSMIKESITKTYEHYDEETDTTTQYKRRARSIRLEGMDWLFAQRKISNLSDDALELAIEYHREILQGMLNEREERRTKKAHRFAGVVLPDMQVGGTKAEITTKVTKKISSNKQAANAAAILSSMLAGGMSPAQLLEMLQKSATVKK